MDGGTAPIRSTRFRPSALARLEKMTDARGRSLKIHKLITPRPVLITAEEAAGVDKVAGTLPREPGNRLAASYVNFYYRQ